MHITNSTMALALYIPAVFLAFHDLYAPDFIFANALNWLLRIGMVIVVILVLRNAYNWKIEYEQRILPVKEEVEKMLSELEN